MQSFSYASICKNFVCVTVIPGDIGNKNHLVYAEFIRKSSVSNWTVFNVGCIEEANIEG